MKRLQVVILAFLLTMYMGTIANATNNELSLDEIVQEQEYVRESSGYDTSTSSVATSPTQQEKNIRESANRMMETLGGAAVVDINDPKAAQAGEALKKIVGSLIALLCYIITLGLVLRVILDLAYIGLPFSRKFLGNGFSGNAKAGDAGTTGGIGGGFGGMRPGFGGIGGFGGFGG